MLPDDTLANVLYVDLTRKVFRIENRHDLFEKNLGGAGVAARLLTEECPEGCDALGPDNPIVLAVGPLTGVFPLASKTVAMFKSPHTGNLGESHCGGRSATAIRMAGYGAVVIKGASDLPVYLAVHGDKVAFRDASTLWGMSSSFTVGRVIRRAEPNAGLRTIMRIGRAGEALVSYAGVTTETYRHFGRLGLGAVFGSKKLKALAISGRRSLPVADPREYQGLYDSIYEAAVSSPAMKKYHELGTAQNVSSLNELGGLPTRNLKEARFDSAAALSGEDLAANYLGRRLACSHCPVACIHIAALREPYEDEPYFYKTSMISYDYEPIYALGSMLGMGDATGFLRLMDAAEKLGIDVMSAGVVLAWATEALERGDISDRETMGLKLVWGDWHTYCEALKRIVEQPNDFYAALARGVEHASREYGGRDYALSFGGNEMAGYHTGPAGHVGLLVGARHSHLDNAGYSVDQKVLMKKSLTPEQLAASLMKEESWRQVLSSLVVCFFARGIYKADVVRDALRLTGFDLDANAQAALGTEILRDKYRFKTREGFSLEDIRIPKRILETSAPVKGWDEDFMRKAITCFARSVSNR